MAGILAICPVRREDTKAEPSGRKVSPQGVSRPVAISVTSRESNGAGLGSDVLSRLQDRQSKTQAIAKIDLTIKDKF